MSAAKYLDSNGLLYLWGKIKALVNTKVTAVTGKQLSTNDYTDTEKSKLAGITASANNYVHPTTSGNKHIPSGGSSGQFLKWSADGTAVWAADNNTTYGVATSSAHGLMDKADKAKLDAFGAAGTYALKSDITSMYRYKGSVAAAANLPTTGNVTGDVYDVQTDGTNYAWNGTAWDALGGSLSIEAITNAEIDTIVAS